MRHQRQQPAEPPLRGAPPRPPRPPSSGLRRRWNDDRFVGAFCIGLLSLVVGLAAFHVVHQAAAPDGSVNGARADDGTDPTATASARSGAAEKPARVRVPASGELFTAAAPLNRIKQDQGSSVELPDGRTLWIFADTFQRTRKPTFFVTSAAATTEPGGRQLTYSLRPKHRTPIEFMPREPDEKTGSVKGEHYKAVWPVGSTQLPDGRIIIAYAKYEVLLETGQFDFLGSGLYEYRYTSAKALHHGGQAKRIADDIWAPYDGEVRSPIYDSGYVYFTQCQELRCYSLRTTPKGLTDRTSYRWFTGSGWSAERDARAVVSIGSQHPGGNASMVKLENGLFAMADTEVGAPSPYGYLWVAARPWGPWSRAASFIMPGCGSRGCYGLNLHPTLSTPNVLRLSYSTVVGPYVRITDIRVSMARDGSAVSVR